MNTISKLLGAFSIAILCGCSVYYSTNQVDTSLKNSINQANTSLSNLELQIHNLQSQYNSIQCDIKNEPMKQADKLYSELQSNLSQINTERNELNKEYSNFQDYTKGKDKIVSGTPEFEKLKVTRESIKTKMSALQSKGESTVQKAQSFSDFVSKSVIPTMQLCDVVSFKGKIDKAVTDLNLAQYNFEQELQKNEQLINQYVAKNDRNRTTLQSDLEKLHGYLTEINTVKTNMESISNDFNSNTLGQKTISSCSKNWYIVEKTEKSIAENQQKMNAISSSINAVASDIEHLAK